MHRGVQYIKYRSKFFNGIYPARPDTGPRHVSLVKTMGRTKIFRVIDNRFLFCCSSCQAKRRLFVAPHLRQKNIRCHKCGEINPCSFNRRLVQREHQTGQAVLITSGGKEVDVDLTDISHKGLGMEISIKALRSRAVKIGDEVRLVCNWNPGLFKGTRYLVQNIRDQKVGLKKLDPGKHR